MARRRRRGKKEKKKEERCPVCGSNVKNRDKHLSSKHPDIYEDMKLEGLRKLIIEEKLSDDEMYAMAEEFFSGHEYNLVLEALKDINPVFPDIASVYNLAGGSSGELGNYGEAEHYFNRARVLEPDNPELCCNLALTYAINNKMYAALEEMEKVDLSKAEPEHKLQIKEMKKLIDKQVDGSSRAQGLTKEQFMNANRAFMEGFDLLLAGNYEKSIDKFEEHLEIAPGSYRAYGNIGIAYLKLDKHSKAKQNFERSLSINPDYTLAKNNLNVLNNMEKGERTGIGVNIKLLSAEERRFVPSSEIISEDMESMIYSTAFYSVKNAKKLRKVLFKNEDFDVIESGKHFIEAQWSREDPEHPLRGMLPGEFSEPTSVLGKITLRWDDLKLYAVSRGRLRVLQNILLEKCGLNDALEFEEEYFEEAVTPEMAGLEEDSDGENYRTVKPHNVQEIIKWIEEQLRA